MLGRDRSGRLSRHQMTDLTAIDQAQLGWLAPRAAA
jgi:hypothetical protein